MFGPLASFLTSVVTGLQVLIAPVGALGIIGSGILFLIGDHRAAKSTFIGVVIGLGLMLVAITLSQSIASAAH